MCIKQLMFQQKHRPGQFWRTSCGTHAPRSFDLCHLLDDSILPEAGSGASVPQMA